MYVRRSLAAAMTAVALLAAGGCSVMRDQQTAGSYVDDAALTTRVKARFAEDKTVSAMAITVETFQGVVQLSGFVKSSEERALAESLAKNTSGVKGVKNSLSVRAPA